MRKLLVVALMMTLFGSMAAHSNVIAQTTAAGPAIGDTVPFYSSDGNQVGTITVNAITDPFEEFDVSYAPQRGYHYVALDITISNGSQRPIEVDPYDFIVVDSDGFIANSVSMYLDAASTATLLEYSDALAPGSEVSGLIAFEAFTGTTTSRVLYAPDFDISTTIADLRTEQVAAGTPVSIMGTSGTEIAQVTVNGIADPFEAYDEFSAPPRGSRFVAVDVTVTNTSSGTLSTSPSTFYATDDIGFYLEMPFVTSIDPGMVNFDYLDLAPGEEQRGIIYYQVLEGIPVVQITYGDGYVTSNVVADLALGAPPIAAQPTVAAVPSSPDCEGLVEWGTDLTARLNASVALTDTFDDVEPADLDPVAVRDAADQFAVFAQETRDSNPPVAAQALNTYFAEEFYQGLSDAANQIADSLETGDSAGAESAVATAEAMLDAFEDGGEALVMLEALETACPNEIEQLNNL